MNRECCFALLCLTWVGMVVSPLIVRNYLELAVAWLAALPLAAWAYSRMLARVARGLSKWKEAHASGSATPAPREVVIYTARGCPSCPVVKDRLIALSQAMSFSLKEVDVTLKPGMLIVKGVRALPVVECGAWRVEGNVASDRLANLIAGSYAGQPVLAR